MVLAQQKQSMNSINFEDLAATNNKSSTKKSDKNKSEDKTGKSNSKTKKFYKKNSKSKGKKRNG